MESGGSSNTMQTYHERTGIVINAEGGRTSMTDETDIINPPQRQSLKRPKDQYMPIAHVVRIIHHVLPPHAKIADDAKETIQECVSEFINFVTTRANERCHGKYRKTISPEDLLSAMASLGFDNYVEPLTVFLDKQRAQDPDRRPTHHRHTPYARPMAQMAPPRALAPRPPPMNQHLGLMPPQMDQDNGGEGFSAGADFYPFAELSK